MPPSPAADTYPQADPPYAHSSGDEPLPGYVITEPLGRGGFGEVWACVAPGGLKKAIKFVSAGDDGDGAQFRQELDAFEQIKEIRHPFLLSLERVEVVGNDLVMVMELADQQLLDRFKDCRAAGLRGIPRRELLGYLGEAAEALDVISDRFGLQHLDVKPANLFVTAGHVKVGDYGLVSRLDAGGAKNRGLTPKYVAPEVLRGSVHLRSDQYSLALVYCELLTGTFPYAARTSQQMMLAHVSSLPDVNTLPECDRGPVWTALQKKPEDRFPTCVEFVHALVEADYVPEDEPAQPPPPPHAGRSTIIPRMTRTETTPAPAGEKTGRFPRPAGASGEVSGRFPRPTGASGSQPRPAPRPGGSGEGPRPGELTKNATWKTVPRLTTPGISNGGPRLVTPGSRLAAAPPPSAPPASRAAFVPADEGLPEAEPDADGRVRVNPIKSVVPAGLFRGDNPPRATFTAEDFALGVLRAAAGGAHVPQLPGDLGRTVDGTWVCQFPSTVPAQVVALKLSVLKETWSVAVDSSEPGRVVLRRVAGGGGWFSKKQSGFEVVVQLPKGGKSVGEVTLTGAIFGTPDKQFIQAAQDVIPRLLMDVRRELGNVQDRRRAPRLAFHTPVTVHPLHSDGTADSPVRGACLDVAVGGVAFSTREPITTKYAYLEFDAVVDTAGLAVLVRVVRSVCPLGSQNALYGVQYRTDL